MSNNIEEIAIIGMSGAFPGAKNLKEFWDMIKEGEEGISTLDRDQLLLSGENTEDIDNLSYVPRGGFVDEADLFDSKFFNMTPAESLVTDPQHRLFLSHCFLALENAGYTPDKLDVSTGVFGGECATRYWFFLKSQFLSSGMDDFRQMIGNEKDFLSTRVSYKLNLRGPSITVQTACSTGLTAVYQACQSLLTYSCDMALAGGITITAPRKRGYLHYDGMIFSKTGMCRPFDEKADGTLFGEGVGVVCLKRLSEAVEDSDYIYAVIKTVAMNNDGSEKIGFAAPGVNGQAEVINLAHVMADVSPEDIGFVETHGTATPIGDPIEVSALSQAFRKGTDKRNFCYLGSIKANVGHLDAAAGIVSLMKTALVVNSGIIPPMRNFEKPNPLLEIENTPFLINKENIEWPLKNGKRIAGVSSFGIGGTNVHAIIESPPARKSAHLSTESPQMNLRLSAKSIYSLNAIRSNIAQFLKENSDTDMNEVINRIMKPEHDFLFRWGTVVTDRERLITELLRPIDECSAADRTGAVFVFSGQGSQFSGMAANYYGKFPVFSSWIDKGLFLCEQYGFDKFRTYLFEEGHDEEISETETTQPLLFIIEYALAKELESRGIVPFAVAGHSIGEYVAAAVAGVMNFEDALRLVCRRGYWMQRAPRGAMTALSVSYEEAEKYLSPGIYISLNNTKTQTVFSGKTEDIEVLEKKFSSDGLKYRRLKTSHAFHSPLMDDVSDEFSKELDNFEFNKPSVPFLSNIDGKWIEDNTDWKKYWKIQLKHPVRFDLCIDTIKAVEKVIVMEVGPGKVLSNFIRSSVESEIDVLSLLRDRDSDASYFEQNIIHAWECGVSVDFPGIKKVSSDLLFIPGYSFVPEKFWPEPNPDMKTAGNPVQLSAAYVERTADESDSAVSEIDRVLKLWKKVIGCSFAGPDDDFFKSGGDSLTSVQFVQSVKSTFKIDFSISQFLKNPTPQCVADYIKLFFEKIETYGKPETIIKKRKSEGPVSLSPQQERMWFLHELDPEKPLYNLVHIIGIEGLYSADKIEESLRMFFARHEIFRAYVDISEERARLGFVKEAKIPIESVNLTGMDEEEAEKTFKDIVISENRNVLDFTKYPFIRSKIFSFSGEKKKICRVCLFIPHMFTDGWSTDIFLNEIREIYNGRELPELPIQYSDYAEWEKDQKENRIMSEELTGFWKEYLKDIPEVHELPLDYVRPKEISGKGGTLNFSLDADLSEKIKKVCERNRITPNVFLLSALTILIWKYSSQETVMIGTPYANREHEELKNVFGYFIRTIPLRFDVDGEKSREDWFAYVKEQFLSAWSMSGLGLDELVDLLEVPRTMNVNPIYQVLFAFQNYGMKKNAEDGVVSFTQEFGDRGVSENDLALYMWESGVFSGVLEYSSDLFEKSSMEVLLKNFVNVIVALTEEDKSDLENLQLTGSRDKEYIRELNRTSVPDYLNKTFPDLFRESVKRYGEKTAVRSGNSILTYAELDEESDRIASLLLDSGVKPGSFVGVYLERGLKLPGILTGVLKAGCAYVPLDPHFPDERLKMIVEDSGIEYLLTERSLKESGLVKDSSLKILTAEESGREVKNREYPEISPDMHAYMLFTSGSTGRPKGVAITHGSLANFLLTMKDKPGITEKDCLLALTTISFDISGLELYLPLITGASMVIVDHETGLDGSALSSVIVKENVNFIQATPSTWTLLFESGWKANSSMKLLTGGEALSRSLAEEMIAGGAEVWNMYGPTETTIWSSLARITKTERDPYIGSPVANTSFYIVDGKRCVLPEGIPGELAIGGAGLSTGYFGREDLTRERFVEIETPSGKERVYLTGDLVQLTSSGDYRYLGRMDFQVKIRGFRIELGEIENTFLKYPEILEAVCTVWTRSETDKRLVGYYRSEDTVDEDNLKNHLKSSLPDYMIPGHLMRMKEFPKTGSGKTDRKAFPLPDDSDMYDGLREKTEPRTEVERKLYEIWKEVLETGNFGVGDNFFNLGGHSLLAASLIRRMNERLGMNWQLRDLFAYPTIEALAAKIEPVSHEANRNDLAPIEKRKSEGPVPLSPQQERLWFLHELDPDKPLYNLVHIIEIEGKYTVNKIEESLKIFFERHELFRAYVNSSDVKSKLEFVKETHVPVEHFDFTVKNHEDAEKEFTEFLIAENRQPVDFTKYPFIKSGIFSFSDNICRICLFVPHMFTDGWSSDIFLNELSEIYNGIENGLNNLQPLSIQYSDYAEWEIKQKEKRIVSDELTDFWKTYLKGIPEVHELPLDYPRPGEISGKGRVVSFTIDAEMTDQIHKVCIKNEITPNVFFLSALVLLIWKYSSQETVVIGTPYANREHDELKNIFGYFIRTIPLRFDVNSEIKMKNWFSYVKEQFLSAWSMSGLGLDELVDLIEVPRKMNINPIFQIVFAFQSYGKKKSDNGDIKFRQKLHDRGVSENDIAVYMWETDIFSGALEYASDLFDRGSMELLLKNFQNIIRELAGKNNSDLNHLDLTDKNDIEHINSLNATLLPEYLNATFPELFRKTCKKYNRKAALKYGNTELTYTELDMASDHIAQRLLESGLKPGSFAGVYLERSHLLPEVLLGVMKAGCAYVPLDSHFPDERLKLIIEDSKIGYLVTENSLSGSELVKKSELKIFIADDKSEIKYDRNFKYPLISRNSHAYMLFTSGSTGRPKGVPITHGALANFLLTMKDKPGITENDRVLAHTTISFDISVFEMILPLITGAQVILINDNTASDVMKLIHVIDNENITFVQATPSRWLLIFEAGWKGRSGMKFLTGGETLNRSLAQKMLETGAEVWNGYGPTETTVCSSMYRVVGVEKDPYIGKPVANTQFYVLDNDNRMLPAGIPGELAIGGAGLSTGYYDREDLTKDRFVKILSADGKSRERIYKTGDLVQLTASGDYRYLGRMDFQVKIRGFRIELGEIENTFLKYPGILEAVCTVWTRSETDKRLVGYYRSSERIDEEELKNHLRSSLPDYMIPGHLMRMSEFPKTGSGKTDRKRFPLPDDSDIYEEIREIKEPGTEIERKMHAIWKEVLDTSNLGISDNFFNLGGHSLLAASLIRKMNEQLKMNWQLRDLFAYPTIEALISNVNRKIMDIPLMFPVQKTGNKTPFFLAAGVYENRYYEGDGVSDYERDFLRYFNNILVMIGKDRPVYGLRPQGILKGESFHNSVEDMAHEYVREIKQIQPSGPYLIGGECLGGNVAYEIARQLRENGDNVYKLILLDTYRMTSRFERRYKFLNRMRIIKRDIMELSGFNGIKNKTFSERIARFRKVSFPFTKKEKEFRKLELGANVYTSLLLKYRPEKYDGNVLLIINEEWNELSPSLFWDSRICPNLAIKVVRGDHETRLKNFSQNLKEILTENMDI